MHDPRVGRFFAVDPLAPKYPHNSPYAFSENRVLDAVELEGLEAHIIGGNPNPEFGPQTEQETPTTIYGPYTEGGAYDVYTMGTFNIETVYIETVRTSLAAANRNRWSVKAGAYEKVNSNTLIFTPNVGRPEYQFIYPQDMGDWNERGSDGKYWIGCMSCHADDGAYRYAAYNSAERIRGMWISAFLDFGISKAMGPVKSTLPTRTVGAARKGYSWPLKTMTAEEIYKANCAADALKVQKSIGGDIMRISPKKGDFLGPVHFGDEIIDGWNWHEAVVKDGFVYDRLTDEAGMPLEQYKTLFPYNSDLNFKIK